MSQERLEEKAQRIYDIVEQCQSSSQHKKDFCHAQNIPLSKYYYWQKKYYEEFHKKDRVFVAIDTHTADREECQMKINLPMVLVFNLRWILCQKESAPILNDLHNYVKTQLREVLPKSTMGKAIAYTLNPKY